MNCARASHTVFPPHNIPRPRFLCLFVNYIQLDYIVPYNASSLFVSNPPNETRVHVYNIVIKSLQFYVNDQIVFAQVSHAKKEI
jgi:hypothetical protein